MIPSNRWFPGNLPDRADWYGNFNTQIQIIGASLGLSPAEIAQIAADNLVIQALAQIAIELDAYKEAVRQYRIIITEGDIGDPTPAFPAVPGYASPGGVPTGIFERLDAFVRRIRAASGYTNEIGALLGILISKPSTPPENELKPVITVSGSFQMYKFMVNVTRLGMEAFKIQIQRKSQSNWTDVAFATSNPCEVTITPTTPGDPERVYVRAILMQKNQEVGIPSDPTYVTANP